MSPTNLIYLTKISNMFVSVKKTLLPRVQKENTRAS